MCALCGLLLSAITVFANIPGGGTGTGANVTMMDNGDGTVTMANGIVSIHFIKSEQPSTKSITPTTTAAATRRSKCWRAARMAASFIGNLAAGAAVRLIPSCPTTAATMRKLICSEFAPHEWVGGRPFFDAARFAGILCHADLEPSPQDAAIGTGEERDNIYTAPYFNWMSVNRPGQPARGGIERHLCGRRIIHPGKFA